MKNQIVIPTLESVMRGVVNNDLKFKPCVGTLHKGLFDLYKITIWRTYIYNEINDPNLHRDEDF